MSRFTEYFGRQCGNPTGIIGKIMTLGMNIANSKMYHAIINKSEADSNSNLLEIGYGNGKTMNLMYKKTHTKITGIDISEDMYKQAVKRNAKGINNGDINLSLGDVCNLQFSDKQFDCVTTINTIYFWNDTLKGMQEIYRVLKEGGRFVNAVYSQESLKKIVYTKNVFNFFSEKEYEELGKKAGFKNISFEKIGDASFLIVFEK